MHSYPYILCGSSLMLCVRVRACTCVHMPIYSVRVCCAYANVVNQRLAKHLRQNKNRGIATVSVLTLAVSFMMLTLYCCLHERKTTDAIETLALAAV